ncbi:hypothetical protein NDU88_004559 [Pleurodeles waltl]|uniref:Uncharacterized protein n=1 Tax=Pleurodeles waltl TaxID=8319 RepID=A0AAV7WW60_PLEWA|nr:hypothetical protein NDU88_004559 [Pleurodeles waltl]
MCGDRCQIEKYGAWSGHGARWPPDLRAPRGGWAWARDEGAEGARKLFPGAQRRSESTVRAGPPPKSAADQRPPAFSEPGAIEDDQAVQERRGYSWVPNLRRPPVTIAPTSFPLCRWCTANGGGLGLWESGASEPRHPGTYYLQRA